MPTQGGSRWPRWISWAAGILGTAFVGAGCARLLPLDAACALGLLAVVVLTAIFSKDKQRRDDAIAVLKVLFGRTQ